MTVSNVCAQAREQVVPYVDGTLSAEEKSAIEDHLLSCERCREAVQCHRGVLDLMRGTLGPAALNPAFVHETGKRLRAILEAPEEYSSAFETAASGLGLQSRLGGAPWWGVSLVLHVLAILLAGLISMGMELPRTDESVIMVTELLPCKEVKTEEEQKPRTETRNALESRHETPPADAASPEHSDVAVPPDILAKAEVGDHFETISLDRPDTQSAFGNPDAQMFHSVQGNSEPEGGGGMGGSSLDDLLGAGGAASPGSGGGWGGGHGTGIGVGSGAGRGSFGNRNGGGRKLMVRRHGGSAATESAVDKALQWLAYHQEADGHWDTKKHASTFKSDTAMTSLSLLAFLGAGHTEKVGQYRNNVQRAVAWLKSKQDANGRPYDATDEDNGEGKAAYGPGYSCAMATMALSEAAGMANLKETREAAQKAVNYCTEIHQNGTGPSEKLAWRYRARDNQDISVTGWFIMALKSAKVAGLQVNHASFEGAARFLDKVELKDIPGDNGYGPCVRYAYQPGLVISPYRNAAIGILGRQFLGWEKEKLQGGVEWFVKTGGVPSYGAMDLYFWYYGTLAVFQQGGDVWNRWNEALKKALVDNQCANGDDTGSWAPKGIYSESWGRVGQTALSALSLEVYYRYQKLIPDK